MGRLYRAICAWLEASAKVMAEPEEFFPEGAGEARSEHAHSYAVPPELHIRSDRQPLYEDHDGSYRVSMPRSASTGRYKSTAEREQPIGFTRNPR